MRKLRRRYRKTLSQLKFAVITVALVAVVISHMASIRLGPYKWLIPAFAVSWFFLKLLYPLFFRPKTYVNEHGYVVLSGTNELEHRHIAKKLLGRNLQRNEVVHHINGKKTDNSVSNLCLMDGEKHEHFHSWLSWKKRKSGKYPSFDDQKRLLQSEYGGTLLEKLSTPKKIAVRPLPTPSRGMDHPDQLWPGFDTDETKPNEKISPELQKKLFVELRNERMRLSQERRIPVYVIFHNRTLVEMSEVMPDSKHQMLEVPGVSAEKYEAYGGVFIEVIRKFKTEFSINQKSKKDPA